MAKISLSQLKSKMRQIESQQRQAINRYNQEVRKYNQQVKQAVTKHNSAVRNYNNRLRQYQQAVRTERSTIRTQRITIKYSVLHSSTLSLDTAYSRLENDENKITQTPQGAWFLDSSERETANSLRVANLLEDTDTKAQSEEVEFSDDALMKNQIKEKIETFSSDLAQRWGVSVHWSVIASGRP